MDTGKRQHLQDIYATDQTAKDDFTPQVAQEIVQERKREIRRQRAVSFFLGLTILGLSVGLIFVVVHEYMTIQNTAPAATPIAQEYIPRYSLPAESQWVLDFSKSYGSPKWDGEGERPFDAEWVKKAAFDLVLAEQAAGFKKYREAAEYYEKVLEIFPDIKGVKVPLGTVYFHLNEFDKALALLEDLPDEDLTPNILNNLGAACLGAKAYDKAEKYLKRAIEKQPTYAEPQKNLALLYQAMDREDDAVAAYQKYIDMRPDDIDTRHSYALYLTKIGRWPEAADVLEELTEQITDVPTLYFLLAQVETHNNRPEKAMEALRRGIQLTEPSAALAYMDSKDFAQLRSSDEFQGLIKKLEEEKK